MVRKEPQADLRRTYRKTFEAALAISLATMIAVFKLFPGAGQSTRIEELSPDPIIGEYIPITEHFHPPPPPVRTPVVIEAPDADPLDDLPINTDLRPDKPFPPPVLTGDDSYFEVVEEYPGPIGGYAEIVSKVRYPDLARRVGIEGTVIVLAYVDESGAVVRAEVLRGIGFGCDEEAVRAVQQTRFSPGLQRDKPVKTKLTIPVKFRLRN